MNEYDRKGLTSEQVAESRRLHGDNVITPRKGDSAWKLLLDKFRDPIIQVLLIAALLSLAMAFVPRQAWETPYQFDVGLKRGTIFPSLDKPFLGEEAVPQ